MRPSPADLTTPSGFENTVGVEATWPEAGPGAGSGPASFALDATVDSAALHAGAALASGGASITSLAAADPRLSRSTVLPRIEVHAGELRITQHARPRYQDLRPLGEGGMGEVVLAQDNDIERVVAVKRLLPHLAGTTAVARFAEEIRTVGRLGHPGIAPVHDVGLDERGQLYFVMKYVDGETLEDIIAKLAAGDPAYHARYPFERRVEIIMGVLEALSYAHDQGVVHRDLKPANVMIGAYGEVVLMDWGIAKSTAPGHASDLGATIPEAAAALTKSGRLHQTQHGALLGTPFYMSPEQALARQDTLDARSDIYSLCVMFHELLTLRHYLHGRDDLRSVLDGVANVGPPPISDPGWALSPLQGMVAADLAHVVRKGMQKDPAQRYASAAEMLARLRRRADGDIPIECPVTLWLSAIGRARRTVNRHPYLAGAVIPAFVLVSFLAIVYSAVRLVFG